MRRSIASSAVLALVGGLVQNARAFTSGATDTSNTGKSILKPKADTVVDKKWDPKAPEKRETFKKHDTDATRYGTDDKGKVRFSASGSSWSATRDAEGKWQGQGQSWETDPDQWYGISEQPGSQQLKGKTTHYKLDSKSQRFEKQKEERWGADKHKKQLAWQQGEQKTGASKQQSSDKTSLKMNADHSSTSSKQGFLSDLETTNAAVLNKKGSGETRLDKKHRDGDITWSASGMSWSSHQGADGTWEGAGQAWQVPTTKWDKSKESQVLTGVTQKFKYDSKSGKWKKSAKKQWTLGKDDKNKKLGSSGSTKAKAKKLALAGKSKAKLLGKKLARGGKSALKKAKKLSKKASSKLSGKK